MIWVHKKLLLSCLVLLGCGAVWSAYLIWVQGVAGSNPVIPAVYVAQLAEQRLVVPLVVGSSPIMHLRTRTANFLKCLAILGYRQAVRHEVLILALPGSNPGTPAKYTVGNRILNMIGGM